MFHHLTGKTPGLYTYVSSESSKIGCKTKEIAVLSHTFLKVFYKKHPIKLIDYKTIS